MKKIYMIGLDIGSYKIKASACEAADVQPLVISSVSGPSHGLKDGSVIDSNNLSSAISDVVEKLSRALDHAMGSAVVNISGLGILGEPSSGVVSLNHKTTEISQQDVKNVLAVARALPFGIDREIIHSIPREYKIDNQKGVKNPVGLFGSKLEVDSYIISAKVSLIQNIVKCVNCAGLEVEELVFSGLATATSVIMEDEKKDGIIVIDVGADFTEISVFKEGNLIGLSILEAGGNDLRDALSAHFRINSEHAENIKNRYGTIRQSAPDNGMPAEAGTHFLGLNFSKAELNAVLSERAKDIIAAINEKIEPYKKSSFAGVVMAGGTSLTEGFLELSEKEFGLPTRIAIPKKVKGNPRDLSALYATSIGLAQYALEKKDSQPSSKKIKNRFKRGIVRAKELFYDYF